MSLELTRNTDVEYRWPMSTSHVTKFPVIVGGETWMSNKHDHIQKTGHGRYNKHWYPSKNNQPIQVTNRQMLFVEEINNI